MYLSFLLVLFYISPFQIVFSVLCERFAVILCHSLELYS